ncbi:sigma-54-dependent transcriptional regulator [Planctomyces sp. SH-PL62]|uniref:sigma-54-dependent transcriptional regulator n=1 Tax=Planctomyces sp. SH-PL62 TaxID=1636152 RepID=UPI00078BD71A|nr:sigma 54-interacting transcriptional regulator [Planctomyces sp. SH-PL62]AMV36301.1 Transcriptional regulatory protein ZraR [Planctomyces sp. SH-PL62]
MHKNRILIVCPDASGLALLTSMLKSLGHVIDEAPNDRTALRLLERDPADLVLASVDPGDSDCLELLSYVRRKHARTPVVLMFPRLHAERAKEATKQGAAAVLRYPAPAAELRAAVLQALEQNADRRPSSASFASGGPLDPASGSRPGFGGGPGASNASVASDSSYSAYQGSDGPAAEALAEHVGTAPIDQAADRDFVGADPCLRQILGLAGSLAASSATVLIEGEPGTGKSELALRLHLGAGHGDRPFVALHAAELIESSAGDAQDGPASPQKNLGLEWTNKLARAAGGTLFIEEVGALDSQLQLQLLREIQLQDMEAASGRSGGYRRAMARIILSTSEDLGSLVEQGRFRQELHQRISSLRLAMPPLRHRGHDVELLAEHFRSKFAEQFDRNVAGFTRDALEVLQRHDWPGNVRELQGVVQRAVVLCHGPRITATHLGPILNPHRGGRGARTNNGRPHLPMGIRPLKEALEEPEKQIIIQALQALNWNRQETARMLDINRTTLYKKMKKYGLLVDEPMWVD